MTLDPEQFNRITQIMEGIGYGIISLTVTIALVSYCICKKK